MWQRFTERARKVVFYAQEEARKWGENFVSPEHLLLGLIHEEDSMAGRILGHLGAPPDLVRKNVQERLQPGEGWQNLDLQLTPAAKKVIDLAYNEARGLKNDYIGTEHLLLGLIRREESPAALVLTGLGVTLEGVREQTRLLQQGQPKADTGASPGNAAAEKSHWLSRRSQQTQDSGPPPGMSPPEELLSLDEAVKFLSTSKPTLYRLLGQDEIKGLKVGRQWRFRRADLIAYMERGPVAVAAAPSEDLDMELAFFSEQLGQEPAPPSDAEGKTVTLAGQIIALAIQSRASDIHLEPTRDDFLLRLRVDGVLQETRRLPSVMRESLAAQFKTMAEMDVNEKRLPQDGRLPVRHNGKDFDIRVAVVPSLYGEAITMRILTKQDILLGLDNLGIAPEDLQQIRDLTHQPNGIVIATGPTGSGKTTLLYSCLQEVAGVEKKTLTVEDPVEHVLPYTTQTQINKKAGLTFAAALRSFLRQDPDVLLISELRDLETAQITVQASLTGHLALTALHAGDAPSALLRLLGMGVEPYLISATVSGVIATRLVRRVCENCRQPVDLSSEPTLSYLTQLAAEGGYEIPAGAVFVRGAGCEQCRGRGYRGRTGLYEVLTMTDALADAILRRAPVEELAGLAVAGGMRTLLADGVRKAVAGQTTIEEVMRVVTVSV